MVATLVIDHDLGDLNSLSDEQLRSSILEMQQTL